MAVYGHSLPGRPLTAWELLRDHHAAVGERAAAFAAVFGWAEAARATGYLHDIGKVSPEVQRYLRGEGPSRDHSTAGARVAAAYPGLLGRTLAAIVAGHHAGLCDGPDLDRRLDPAHDIPAYDGWQAQTAPLPPFAALRPDRRPTANAAKGFDWAMLTRMLFSCLVDADFLETERFYAGGAPVARGGHPDIAILRDRLRAHLAGLGAVPSPVNALRGEILDHAVGRAGLAPGLFTLTVPTGGGKTLASLAFALEHAAIHGLRRVIHVAPFTAIIEQNAAVFRHALGADAGVLEHHASFDWEAAGAADEGFGADAASRLRRAAENWDAPVVATTAVQFFESLFANRTARCRKLHNIAGSVVVLDEAQAMPLRLLRPCLAAIAELAANYRVSLVLCTATQPALRAIDGFPGGLEVDAERELAPDPPRLYRQFRRVAVEHRGPVADAGVAARFGEAPRMLCIVNSRAQARALFEGIRDLPGAVHLSTLMCPRHRRTVLDDARARLRTADAPVRIVSTSLIEAGVDIDLPEVWRAAAGLDAVAQAAGRCNREGRMAAGRVVVFEAEGRLPRDLEAPWAAALPHLRTAEDPLAAEAVRAYFRELYFRKGPAALDAGRRDGQVWPILPHIAERAGTGAFPFASIAQVFRLVDEAMEPVIVPWRADAQDTAAAELLGRIAAMDRPLAADLRSLQGYTVPVPARIRAAWLAQGLLRPVHPGLGEALLRLDDLDLYDPRTGLRLDGPAERAAEDNIIA